MTAYLNGSFIPMSEAKVSVLDRGFLFADAIYEVGAVLDGKLVDNESHLMRLKRSAGEISLKLPVSLERVQEIQKELVARNKITSGLTYLQLTRGANPGGRNFLFPAKDIPSTFVVFTRATELVDTPEAKTGIGVISVPDIRWGRRDIKSVMLLAQVQARQTAEEAGAGEALMVQDGFVTEGTASTAFILTREDVIVTRPNSTIILPGCTRKAVQALAEERRMRVEDRAFTVAEAQEAKEVFVTNASLFVQPVISVDGKEIGNGKPGPITQRLREIYIEFARATAV